MAIDWKITEKVVAKIEEKINSSSLVEHNVRLPVIGDPNNGVRQCDVVIRTGSPPRETLTIVEVQNRDSRVDINTFGGWLEKMKEVGAQHLICVSKHPYPKSIISKAKKHGNSVSLIQLDLDKKKKNGTPLENISTISTEIVRERTLVSFSEIMLHSDYADVLGLGDTVSLTKHQFFYKGHSLSFDDLCYFWLDESNINKDISGEITLNIYINGIDSELFLIHGKNKIQVTNLTGSVNFLIEVEAKEMTFGRYIQDGKVLGHVLFEGNNDDNYGLFAFEDEEGQIKIALEHF